MKVCVYILRCFKYDGSYIYYKGSTNNLRRRLNEHRNGLGRYTKRFKGHVILVYFKWYKNRSEAMRREKELKNMPRKEIEKLIWL